MSSMTDKRYRVAQWGTGHSGMPALRALIEHPVFELVGVRVYSNKKAGRDAGELCGAGPTGVIATTSIDDIVAAKPDCVVYMPVGPDFDDICTLLESGINISTLLEHFHDPAALEPRVRQRIEQACERGNASIYSSGPSPGFVTESLPLVLTSIERRLDCYRIEEYADMSHRNSPEMFALLGFGGDPGAVDANLLGQGVSVAYGSSLRRLAEALSFEFDDVTVMTEVATATKPVQTASGAIEAGTLAAWRFEVSGVRDRKPLMQMVPTWYLTTDLEPAWNIPFPGRAGGSRSTVTCRWTSRSDSRGTLRSRGAPRLRQCQPPDQRGAQRLRGAARHPLHLRSAPDHLETALIPRR